jgi:hypothetical protein
MKRRAFISLVGGAAAAASRDACAAADDAGVHARYKFNALAFSLESLSYALKRQKSSLPASLAQEKDAPTMAHLKREIRTLLKRHSA